MLSVRHRSRRLAASLAPYDGAFKMLVDTTKAGSASDTFVLPCGTGGGYNALIQWGDGSSQVILGAPGNVSHTYRTAGLYVVSITEITRGGFPKIYFFGGGDCLKVMAIVQWGSGLWSTMSSAFLGCANLDILDMDVSKMDTSGVTAWDGMFYNCSSLRRFPKFDTSSATNFYTLVAGCTLLTDFPVLDAHAVTNAAFAWSGAGITAFPAIDLSACTTFQGAWSSCHSLTSFGACKTTSGQNFQTAWYDCPGLNGYALPALDMHAMSNGLLIFGTIDKGAYNSILDQLASGRGAVPANTNTGVTLSSSAHYDASTGGYNGTAARAVLAGHSWSITDGGTP